MPGHDEAPPNPWLSDSDLLLNLVKVPKAGANSRIYGIYSNF